jgi:uncharacterized membrane protein YeaQ/YmgE (transglycosylase-associated protein family)
MEFVLGFVIWIFFGLVGGYLLNNFFRGPETTLLMTLTLGVFGAFIGGMLASSGYIFHAPTPLRFGALLGAALGGTGFPAIYHYIARKAL